MATKKISELPLITALSGSQEETLIPVVVGGLNGTTNRITAENFSKFVNAYNATTSSNTFIGAQIINGNLTITGNQVISGRLTVNELVAQYETASIIFSSGSNKFGDELVDKQEFTGSVEITGSIIVNGNLLLNGASLNNSFVRIHQATGSLQNFTSSQADRNLDLSIVTGSINQFTASQDDRNFVISQFTSSTDAHIVGISDFTSSQLIVNTGLASVTASLNNFSGSTNAFTGSIERTTASIHLATASLNYFYQSTSSLNAFTASQDSRNFTISQFTSSTDAHIVGISAFTSSQLAVNLGNAIYTASVDSHIVGISTYTSSVRDTLARVHQATESIQFQTASLLAFTASQDGRNLTLSTVTGSLIGITNGLMAFTAALDNTYATDAQLYQLYQATRSIELHSGSMIGVTNGLMAYTASNSTLNTGLRGEVDGIEAYTASLKAQAIVSSSTQVQNYDVFALNSNLYTSTGSLIGITNGLMAFTAALDNTYATDAQLYQLYQATRSIELTTGSLIGITNGLMAFTAALDNTYATDAQLLPILQATQSLELFSGSLIGITNGLMAFTAALDNTYATDAQLYQLYQSTQSLELHSGSIVGVTNGLMAYTASLKGAAIVSSSQQVQNYFTFAKTGSANTFYGNQTITGSVSMTGSLRVGDWIGGSPHVDETARFDVRTTVDRGIKITGNVSSDVIITAYRGATDDLVRGMRLQANGIGIYIGDGNANTGSSVASFNTNGLAFEAGKGIDFSATSNGSGTTSSELLNDYEEGTWTPTLGGGSSDPTGVTYDVQTGNYTKVGRLVTINFIMGFTTYTGGTGAVFVRGLPFACAGGNAANGAGQLEQFSFTGGRTYATLRVNSGDSVIDPQQMGASTSWTAFTHGTNITSSGTAKYITGTVTYTT